MFSFPASLVLSIGLSLKPGVGLSSSRVYTTGVTPSIEYLGKSFTVTLQLFSEVRVYVSLPDKSTLSASA